MIEKTQIGIDPRTNKTVFDDKVFMEYVNLRLAALDQPVYGKEDDYPFMDTAKPLLLNYKEMFRDIGAHYYCPADERIMTFLKNYFKRSGIDVDDADIALPLKTLAVDRYGMARTLSLPPDADKYESDMVSSYRVKQGVLHNPKNDRRTTKGVFHVAEGGLPIPDDKKAVPISVFLNLYKAAINIPEKYLELPFTSTQEKHAKVWVSLYMRPVVCPEIPNTSNERRMEIRMFAPGNLVSNVDFAESIFGNFGNPYLRENDPALDFENWTGHTGCIILAPHLSSITKKNAGLPRFEDATERQRRDGMCWKDENELYNDGEAFKITARDSSGAIVTIISDNYFGYTKKEVKTQISFSANLYGQCEEEHSGGAIAFSSRDLGEDFIMSRYLPQDAMTFEEAMELLGGRVDVNPDGWAADKVFPNIIYVDSHSYFSLKTQSITWNKNGEEKRLHLVPNTTYVSPWGYKVKMMRPHEQRRWRLVGSLEEGVFCHKPATVSGGGKSEISKDISDAIIHGPSIVADFKNDIEEVEKIINKNYGDRFKDEAENHHEKSRKILDPRRTMGSVVKLLTPSPLYTDEYNAWLKSIPFYIREFVLTVKRHYRESWGGDWKKMFTVDSIDGKYGNILKFRSATVLTSYLRVGFMPDGSWRTFSLRKDFFPSYKIQMEDDITSSVVSPSANIEYLPKGMKEYYRSVKFVDNCEYRLFQRPDEAVIRGQDKRAERDMSQSGVFLSNYQPLTHDEVRAMAQDVIRFYNYTPPMRENLEEFLKNPKPDYVVSSAHPRLVDGKPSKNVRYLQDREDLVNPCKYYVAEVGMRLKRRIPLDKKVPMPVSAVISGRRNNPASDGIRPLAVHGPLSYLELPELFMEYIASMTGKSPSTTGAGLEGAMTKAPFNALCAVSDLNAALLSFALTGYDGWLSSAGYLGPKYRIDHDISLLIPELWCRMRPEERNPQYLIEHKMLERCKDMEFEGKPVLSSRLGWRITEEFVIAFFGRIFSNPASIFTPDMLRPELQDMACFAESMDNITGAHKRAAQAYFNDGSIEGACPPLKALLYIMKDGTYQGKTLADKSIRDMFKYENIVNSDWYAERIVTRQQVKMNFLISEIDYLKKALEKNSNADIKDELLAKIARAQARLKEGRSLSYVKKMAGTLGVDPFLY